MLYSVKVYSTIGSTTRYLSFETYSAAICCIQALTSTTPGGRYYPEDYFQSGTLSVEPQGEVVNAKAIESDFLIKYLGKSIDF